jgi:23S rRNA (cytosine1962-C5)-methyltransferase
LAGNAAQVVQADVSRKFLDPAKRSYAINGWTLPTQEFLTEDFFSTTSRFRHTQRTFDCVIIDPPFFSVTGKGKVDQILKSANLINKVRPLVKEGGWLVAINNALFVSGEEYLQTLKSICKDGYILVDQLMDVPPDVVGFPDTVRGKPPADPDPFNHSTKIALLRVLKRK